MGLLAEMAARARLGRDRGLSPLAAAPLFGPVLKAASEMAGILPDDNVVILGASDLRPAPWIAPACRRLMIVDDLPEQTLTRLEEDQRSRGLDNVRFQWGRARVIPTPQYTTDRILSINYLFRSRDPAVVIRQMHWTCRHGSTVVCCEPSASLNARTARKYSREAELPMEDHRALVSYARAAAAFRGFTSEGLGALLAGAGIQDIEVRELLHGLVLAARGSVRL